MNNLTEDPFKIIGCTLLRLLAYVYVAWFAYNLALGLYSASWVEDSGRIVLNTTQSTDIALITGNRTGNQVKRVPVSFREFRYEYMVNKQTYYGSRVSYFDEDYPIHKYCDLTVYHNKWLPSFSVLNKGLNISTPMALINGTLFILAIFFWYLRYS